MKGDIFEEACDAYVAGKGRDKNPYDKNGQYEQWHEWDIGWELSEEQDNLISLDLRSIC